MADELRVEVTDFVPEFVELLRKGHADRVMLHTMNAIKHIAEMAQTVWVRYASGTPIPGAPRVINSASYARSIQLESRGEYEEVFTTSRYHGLVEKGRPKVDLKPGLLSGPKARQGKNGPYNIVPFRHGTPSANRNPMPANIYRLILRDSQKAEERKQAGLDSKGGTSRVLKASSKPQERAYEWGYRISRKNTQDKKRGWKTGKYAGMVRMDVSTTRARRSQYMTFRVVSINSPPDSWILPPLDPIPIREKVVETVTPIAKQMLAAALEEDLAT